jgi:hypothetical protein
VTIFQIIMMVFRVVSQNKISKNRLRPVAKGRPR